MLEWQNSTHISSIVFCSDISLHTHTTQIFTLVCFSPHNLHCCRMYNCSWRLLKGLHNHSQVFLYKTQACTANLSHFKFLLTIKLYTVVFVVVCLSSEVLCCFHIQSVMLVHWFFYWSILQDVDYVWRLAFFFFFLKNSQETNALRPNALKTAQSFESHVWTCM